MAFHPPRKAQEALLQERVVQIIRLLGKPGLVWGASMSGVKLGIRAAMRMKKQGLNAGESDLWLLIDGQYYGIELKNGKEGRQSDVQKDFERRVKLAGGAYFIARDLETARYILESIGAIRPEAVRIGRAA